MIEFSHITVQYAGRPVLRDVSLTLPPGQCTVLVGPNGSGKSTLLKTALGAVPLCGGEVLCGGRPLGTYTARQMAQKISYLSQSRPVPAMTVYQMVLHGRFPYLKPPRVYREADRQKAEAAMRQTGCLSFSDCLVPRLSGGQQQSVYLAMLLAQDTPVVFLDEPTTYLDIVHQLALMRLARQMAAQGKTVALVLHDLSLALKLADYVAVLRDGRLLQAGTPEEVYTGGALREGFGVEIRRAKISGAWQYYYE